MRATKYRKTRALSGAISCIGDTSFCSFKISHRVYQRLQGIVTRLASASRYGTLQAEKGRVASATTTCPSLPVSCEISHLDNNPGGLKTALGQGARWSEDVCERRKEVDRKE